MVGFIPSGVPISLILLNAPTKSTIDPEMGTMLQDDNISTILFGKARMAVLSLLYGNPDETFYLRQIARNAEAGMGAIQREVANLTTAGIIKRSEIGRQVFYQADRDCPVFPEIKSMILKTFGVGNVLRASFKPLSGHVKVAFVFGSVARGEEKKGSDIDLLLIGDVTLRETVSALQDAQKKLMREINPHIYPTAEFKSKLAAGHHFIKSVVEGPKLFLIGDNRELERLA
jgi:predicted nucleotidyltransferase